MAKIKSGILGGMSGQLGNVIGYRRKSKSIIQGIPIVQPISLNTSIENNKNKFTLLCSQIDRYKTGILLMLKAMGHNSTIDFQKLMKENLSNYTFTNDYRLNSLIFDFQQNIFQPKIDFVPNDYPNQPTIIFRLRSILINNVGVISQNRARYYSYNNSLTLGTVISSADSLGSSTPPMLTPPGEYYMQAARAFNNLTGYESKIAICITQRP